jgi:hypothetical protein
MFRSIATMSRSIATDHRPPQPRHPHLAAPDGRVESIARLAAAASAVQHLTAVQQAVHRVMSTTITKVTGVAATPLGWQHKSARDA